MLIIADSRAPKAAKKKLERLGEVLWLEPQPCAYPAIAAHPDIFFCQIGKTAVAAPNAPQNIVEKLTENALSVSQGKKKIGAKHPETTFYNAVFTDTLFIHHAKLSDESLLARVERRIAVHTPQGYTRCNLMALSETAFLTSDRSIEKALLQQNAEVLFVDPKEILLPGVNHGFIGGCCGMIDRSLVVFGSFDFHSQGAEIRKFIEKQEIDVVELYDGTLWDGGGILCF